MFEPPWWRSKWNTAPSRVALDVSTSNRGAPTTSVSPSNATCHPKAASPLPAPEGDQRMASPQAFDPPVWRPNTKTVPVPPVPLVSAVVSGAPTASQSPDRATERPNWLAPGAFVGVSRIHSPHASGPP